MVLPSSDLYLGRDTRSRSVSGGMHRFSVLHLALIRRVGTAFLILCFICVQGLDRVLRAAEAFPLLQGNRGHHGMSPHALCAPAQAQGIIKPFPLAFLQKGTTQGRERASLTRHKTHSWARQGGKHPAGQAQSIWLEFCSPFALSKYKSLHHASEQ